MKILIAVDGSELALDAVRYALHLLRNGLQASCVLATVQEPTFMYEMILAPDAEVLDRVTGAVGSHALEGAQALFNRCLTAWEKYLYESATYRVLVF
jgi:nucleotide-binding universal stress UspA family protein